MKKLLHYLIPALFLFGCSADEDTIAPAGGWKPDLPSHIEEYGKLLARDIRQTVSQLNREGIDYSDANGSPEFQRKFYTDWLNASPSTTKSGLTADQILPDPVTIVEKYRNLTPAQSGFIRRITDECGRSESYEQFCTALAGITKEIHRDVPVIEQERLLYIVSALYYGLSEIYNLQIKGQFPAASQAGLRASLIKTRSEGGDGFRGSCRQVFQSVCNYVVGAVIDTGEVVTSISRTVVGGVAVFAVVLCFGGDSDFCKAYADKCSEKEWKYEYGSWIRMDCTVCYNFCLRNGYWNHTGCPLD